jgi:hypothetical protein
LTIVDGRVGGQRAPSFVPFVFLGGEPLRQHLEGTIVLFVVVLPDGKEQLAELVSVVARNTELVQRLQIVLGNVGRVFLSKKLVELIIELVEVVPPELAVPQSVL